MNRYWAAFWLVGVIYGTSFILNTVVLHELNPLDIGFLRYALAAVGLSILLRRSGRPLPHDRHSILEMFLIGLGNHALPFVLIVWAQTRVDSGLTAVFMATVPLYSLMIAHFVFEDERINPQKIFGIFLGFAGIIILSSRSFESGLSNGGFLGEAAIITASAMSAAATIYSRRVMRNKPDPMVMSTGAMIVSATLMGVASFAYPAVKSGTVPAFLTGISANIWLTILVMALVNTLIANTLYYYVIGGLGASRSTMVTYVFPPVSLALGAIFLHEVIDARIILGTVIIFSGLAIVNLQRQHSLGTFQRLIRETR